MSLKCIAESIFDSSPFFQLERSIDVLSGTGFHFWAQERVAEKVLSISGGFLGRCVKGV